MTDLIVRPAAATDTKTFKTLLVGTVLCGRALCDATLTELQIVTGWMFGDELWSWEMAHPDIRQAAREAGYRQFPDMPSAEEAKDLRFAVVWALDRHGYAVKVARGPNRRNAADGFDTFERIVGRGGRIRMPMMIRRGQSFA